MAIDKELFYESHGLDFDYKNMLDEYIKGVIRQAKFEVLTEIQLEIEEKSWGTRLDGLEPAVDMVDVNMIIQQKINELKAESEET